MLQMMQSGGWMIVPILICTVLATFICVERAWTLQSSRVAPDFLLPAIIANIREDEFVSTKLFDEMSKYPLGQIFSAGLHKSQHGIDEMKAAMQETSQTVLHSLQKHLTSLGTIVAIVPLMGILGFIVGTIQMLSGTLDGSNAEGLAVGISHALMTVACGIGIAIPALICHRYFLRHLDVLVVGMDSQSRDLIEFIEDHFQTDLEE